MNLKSFKSIFRASFNIQVLVVPFVPCPKEGTKRRNMFVEIKNLDNQITSNEYVIETPEEVTYLFSSYQLERGAKRYELANHLGNVLTVISDKKTAIFTGNTFNYFAAERISATDYSPFGAPLAGRNWQASEYRFGFNTQERDDEIAGVGNIMTAQFWEYDSRLGRRWNKDPKPNLSISIYSVFANNPIWFCDLEGDTIGINLYGKNDVLYQEAQKFVEANQNNDGVFVVFALGDNARIQYTLDGKSYAVKSSDEFDNFITSKSKEWQTSLKSGEKITLVILAFNTASNVYFDNHYSKKWYKVRQTISEKISKKHKNLLVIAPNGFVTFSYKENKLNLSLRNHSFTAGLIHLLNGVKIFKTKETNHFDSKISYPPKPTETK